MVRSHRMSRCYDYGDGDDRYSLRSGDDYQNDMDMLTHLTIVPKRNGFKFNNETL